MADQSLPPGPRSPKFLRLLATIVRPTQTLEAYARRYGDPFTLSAPTKAPLVLFSSPKAIQEIFSQPQHFTSGEGNQELQFLLGDTSLVLLDGDRHQRQRQLLTPPFHGERMRTYGQLIGDITQQVSGQWLPGQPFRVRDAMQDITLRVIMRAVFGIAEGERFEYLHHLLGQLLDGISSPWRSSLFFFSFLQQDWGAWSPWGRVLHLKQRVDDLLLVEIRQRKAESDASRTDILSLLLSATDQSGNPLTEIELRDELITLLVAGHETTASALSWALYWVFSQSDIREKLLLELDTLDPATPPEVISRLPYLSAVCQETLRIYPIGMFTFPRVVQTPVEIMGYTFAPGTWLVPCVYLTHQREDLYPQPKQFQPHRFLERQFSPYEYLPFGGSNRRCLGMAFALFEMKLVLAQLSRLPLALVTKPPVSPVRRGLTLAPPSNLQMVLTAKG